MADRTGGASDLLQMIREKRARIAALESELTTLRSELSAVLRELAPTAAEHEKPVRQRRGTAKDNALRWAENVLRTAGRPLHVTDIMSQIEQVFGEAVRYTTLVTYLTKMAKDAETFYRAGPNMYGLIEQQDAGLLDARGGEGSENT